MDGEKFNVYLGVIVIDARLGSVEIGANRFPPYNSPSSVFCRRPQVFRIRSDISVMSDDELPLIFQMEFIFISLGNSKQQYKPDDFFRC